MPPLKAVAGAMVALVTAAMVWPQAGSAAVGLAGVPVWLLARA
jgi:hypothetical protein